MATNTQTETFIHDKVDDKPILVSVYPEDVRAEVPRMLYGTCLEDVNHEIYGGLDAQRLYDESFEETQPFAPLPHDIDGASGMVCGRQWTEIATGGGESALDDTTAHWGRRSQRLSPEAGTAGVANAGLNGWVFDGDYEQIIRRLTD